jgi:hypothetical protein
VDVLLLRAYASERNMRTGSSPSNGSVRHNIIYSLFNERRRVDNIKMDIREI